MGHKEEMLRNDSQTKNGHVMLQEYLDQLLTPSKRICISDVGRTNRAFEQAPCRNHGHPREDAGAFRDGVRQARQARRGAEPGGHTDGAAATRVQTVSDGRS